MTFLCTLIDQLREIQYCRQARTRIISETAAFDIPHDINMNEDDDDMAMPPPMPTMTISSPTPSEKAAEKPTSLVRNVTTVSEPSPEKNKKQKTDGKDTELKTTSDAVNDSDSDESSVDYVTENIKEIVEFFHPKPRVFVEDEFECNDEIVMRDCFEADILECIDLYLKMTDTKNVKLDKMEIFLCASLRHYFISKSKRLNNLSKHIKDNKCSDVISAVRKSSRGLIELQRSKVILKQLESVLVTEYSGISKQFNDCYDELLLLYCTNRTKMLVEHDGLELYTFVKSGIGLMNDDDYVKSIMKMVKKNLKD